MAQFRVGQRVKLVNHIEQTHWNGVETRISALQGCDANWPECYRVEAIDPRYNKGALVLPVNLAPLTDPGVDAFMERLKKLGDEPNNAVEKERVER